MAEFCNGDFLLSSDTAKILYHEHAEKMPIYDYHNHLSPKDIADHRRFNDLYEMWLETDHYKWRAMRANGVDEYYITGGAEPAEKFRMWARIFPDLIGSPLYHWTRLELKRYFGIDECLCEENADEIYSKTQQMMREGDFDVISLLKKMNVDTLCTTDDPCDDLEYHRQISEDKSVPFAVLPSFRPDKYLDVHAPDWKKNCDRLCQKCQTDDLKEALKRSLDHFCARGCRVSDHGFGVFDYGNETFRELLLYLAELYHERNIVMQIHLSPIRNNSYKLFTSYGPDAGGDSIGAPVDITALNRFFYDLEKKGCLGKAIVYNLNPTDNEALATLANNFAPNVQYGAAWWFNDTYRGIRNQITNLMETASLARSVGMLTDSRSFTSFVRHEYYRRILCEMIGEMVQHGMYPEDIKHLGNMVENICFNNAKAFFEA